MRFLAGLALLCGLLQGSPVQADENAFIANPIWTVAPPEAQIPPDLPLSGYRYDVPLYCEVHGDRLTSCLPVGAPITHEYLQAAIASADAARIAPEDGSGHATEGRRVFLFVEFPRRPDAPASTVTPPAETGVYWMQRPDGRLLERLYPSAARQAHLGGRVMLDCLVLQDGTLICAVAEETPRGAGFGDAALQIARTFRLSARTADGRPTFGGRVRVPLNFGFH